MAGASWGQVNKLEFRVKGACRGRDLREVETGTLAEKEALAAKEKQQQQQKQYNKRRIGHPLFKNGTLEQVRHAAPRAHRASALRRPPLRSAALHCAPPPKRGLHTRPGLPEHALARALLWGTWTARARHGHAVARARIRTRVTATRTRTRRHDHR